MSHAFDTGLTLKLFHEFDMLRISIVKLIFAGFKSFYLANEPMSSHRKMRTVDYVKNVDNRAKFYNRL